MTSSRQPIDFRCELVFGAEQVRVVLGEAAHAGHAAEFAGLLPAIDRAELGQAHGQVAVAARLAGENLDVMRAVHRLEQVAVDLALLHAVGEFGAGAVLLRDFVK